MPCSCKPQATNHHHWTLVAYPSQPRGQLDLPEHQHASMLPECQGQLSGSAMEDDGLGPGDMTYAMFIPPEWEEQYIGATDTPSQWLAQEAQKAEESQPLEDMVPVQYCNFVLHLAPLGMGKAR